MRFTGKNLTLVYYGLRDHAFELRNMVVTAPEDLDERGQAQLAAYEHELKDTEALLALVKKRVFPEGET